MALTALGGMPLVVIGAAGVPSYSALLPGLNNITLDAANEACSFIGQLFWEDGGSHTVDTSGSSSLQWRSNSAIFANAGTTVVVGLADVDSANGSAAPRAVNSSDVITMGVSRSLTGGGAGIANGGWNTTVPTSGSKVIAHGDLVAFCIQMTARGGSDSVNVAYVNHAGGTAPQRPSVGTFLGSAYSAAGGLPNCAVVASDGTLGFIFGALCFTAIGTSVFNSGSSPNERGNVIVPPVPGKVLGIAYATTLAGNTSDFDLVLYSDPLGTPVAERTKSIDANTVGNNTGNTYGIALFSSPYTFTAGQTLAAIFKPTTANSITPSYMQFNSAAHAKSQSLGMAAYAVNRNSGAFSVQNSNLERYGIGLLVDFFDNGAGSGGATVVGVIG